MLQPQVEHQTEVLENSPAISPMTLTGWWRRNTPRVFLGVFVATEEVCRWLGKERTLLLLPLLSGKAQAVAVSLPATAMTNDVMAWPPKDHWHCFWQVEKQLAR